MANELSALALTRLDGSSDSLAQHAGKVLLVVNVASQCGLTPQYEGWKSSTQATASRASRCWAFRPMISAIRSLDRLKISISSAR
jgi:glutathione peroxidase-family protein